MIPVSLDQDAWNRVLAILSQAPWRDSNPLIMAIGEQLRAAQAMAQKQNAGRPNGPNLDVIPTGQPQ